MTTAAVMSAPLSRTLTMSVDDWKKLVDAAGIALLALTLFLGVASWRIGNVISRRDDAAKLKLEGTVLEAKNRLAAQEERAAIAEKATEEIRRENTDRDVRLAAAEKDASDSKAAQQRVEVDLAKQQERAATAELALLELQERIKPRRLLGSDRARFVAFLSSRPKGKVSISWPSNNAEPERLARDIESALIEAGWPEPATGFGTTNETLVGVALLVGDTTNAPPHGKALQDALRIVGIEAAGVEIPGIDETISLRVGVKP